MATGTIKGNPLEYRTVTFRNGFTLESWGYITAVKCGNLMIINGSGIRSASAITTLTEMADVNNTVFTGNTSFTGTVICDDKNTYNIQAWIGGQNILRISAGVPANTNFAFSIVAFCR